VLRMAEDVSYSHINPAQKRLDLANSLKNGFDRSAVALFDQNVRLEEPHKMLYWAAAGGCDLFIRKLLAAKVVPVDFVFENRQTALHIACHFGNYRASLALLECGAINFSQDDFKHSPLDYAKMAKFSMVKVIEWLLESLKAKEVIELP
jgi:ankyrin repeat protein